MYKMQSSDESSPVRDSNSMLEGEHNVLHLQIETQDLLDGKTNENQDGTQVFFVYQDVHTCGVCNKQCYDLIEFLAHKSEHTIGSSIYKCELCKFVLLDQLTLLKHYNDVHNVKSFQPVVQETRVEDVHLRTETVDLLNSTHNDDECDHNLSNVSASDFIQSIKVEPKIRRTNSRSLQADGRGKTQHWHPQTTHRRNQWRGKVTKRPLPTLLRKRKPAVKGTVQALSLARGDRNEVGSLQESVDSALENNVDISSLEHREHSSMDDEGDESEEQGLVDDQETFGEEPNVAEEYEPNDDATPGTPRDFSFVLLTEVVKGNTFSYGRLWFKCLHCDYKTRNKLGITNHMAQKHDSLLDVHEDFEIKPNSDRPGDKLKIMKMSTYETQHSQERKVRRKKRPRKIEKQDVPGAYPCNQCGKVFSRIRYLRKHQETHRTERKFVCEECGKPFKSRTYLRVHKLVHQDKLFNCNQCDFSSGTKAAIHAHRQIHNQGSAICDVCGYAYIDKSTLNKHKRVHDVNRPFACTFTGCTWRFKTEVMCKAHIRAHTSEGKFRCAICGYVFRHKHHLKRHEANMHGLTGAGGHGEEGDPAICAAMLDQVDDEKSLDNINVVISSEIPADQLHLTHGLGAAHLVVSTDSGVAPIGYETDISTFCSAAYQTLSAHADVTEVEHVDDDHTILVSSAPSDTHAIIFQQE